MGHVSGALAVLLASSGIATPAEISVAQCVAAADEGQVLRANGHFVESRRRFSVCADERCPEPITTDCVKWLADVEERTPRIVITVVDEAGADVLGATVRVDGKLIEPALRGRAIEVDPGEHVITAEAAGRKPGQTAVALTEVDQRRRVEVRMSSLPAPAATHAEPSRLLAWVLFGAGAAFVATSGIFFFAAKSDLDDLRARCPGPGDCSVTGARTKGWISDVSLGLGFALTGWGAFSWVSGSEKAR